MNILLFSMPDSFEHMPTIAIRMPNGALTSLAGNGGVSGLEDGEIRPPRRDVRVLGGYTLLGRRVDVIETSRGCTFDCSFCSIIEMHGRNFHTTPNLTKLDKHSDLEDVDEGVFRWRRSCGPVLCWTETRPAAQPRKPPLLRWQTAR